LNPTFVFTLLPCKEVAMASSRAVQKRLKARQVLGIA